MRHHGAKRDANEGDIVRALEATGWLVIRLSSPGMPDLLCIRRGVVVLLEVKTERGTVTPVQAETFLKMQRYGYRVPIVRSAGEALDWVETLCNNHIHTRGEQ